MKTVSISLSLITLTLSACDAGTQRNYSNETADSLRESYTEEQQRTADLHQNGKISKACKDIIITQLDMALKSLKHDAAGEIQERDRAMQLSDEAGLEREKLQGCFKSTFCNTAVLPSVMDNVKSIAEAE